MGPIQIGRLSQMMVIHWNHDDRPSCLSEANMEANMEANLEANREAIKEACIAQPIFDCSLPVRCLFTTPPHCPAIDRIPTNDR